MVDPREVLSTLIKRYPRLISGLDQVVLYVLTLLCAFAIASYDPAPALAPAIHSPTGCPCPPTRIVVKTCYVGREAVCSPQ